jgi:hypothetical protein
MRHRFEQHQIPKAQFPLRCLSFRQLSLNDELVDPICRFDEHSDFISTQVHKTVFIILLPLFESRVSFGQILRW